MISQKYWAADEPKVISNKLLDKVKKRFDLSSNPMHMSMLRNYISYYSTSLTRTQLNTALSHLGRHGEFTKLSSPKARTAIRQTVSIVTSNRLAFQSSAETSNPSASEEVKIANSLTKQIVKTQRLNTKQTSLCEGSFVTGTWFLKTGWRTDQGEPFVRDLEGRIIHTGAVEMVTVAPWDVTWNWNLAWDDQQWAMVQVKRCRWDLIEDHPELEEWIRRLPCAASEDIFSLLDSRYLTDDEQNDDYVNVYEFYHKPTPSIEEGRMFIFSDENTVYYDGDNPYRDIPIEPCSPEEILGSSIGHAKYSDMMPSQEMYDSCVSAIATNQSQFAVQNIIAPAEAGVDIDDLGGLNFITYKPVENVSGGGEPKALNLVQSAPETFKFIDHLANQITELSMLNGALTGSPPPGVTSGTALATLSASAIKFLDNFSKAFNLCLERSMLHAIRAFQSFAKVENQVEMEEARGSKKSRAITGADIANISQISIESINPLMQTFAGRIEVAEKLLSMPKDMWGKYCGILEGKPLSSVYQSETTQEDLIASENAALARGESVRAFITDDHALHIASHADDFNDIAKRTNDESMKSRFDHIIEHFKLAESMDPGLAAIIATGKIPEGGLQPPPPAPGAQPSMQVQPTQPPRLPSSGPAPDNVAELAGDPTIAAGGDIAEPNEDPIAAIRDGV